MPDFLVGKYAGLFAMLCGFGLFFLIVGIAFYGMYRTAKKDRGRIAQAIPATAKVIHVGDSDASSGGIDIDLTFEVMPPNGAPYKAKTNWSVEPLSVSKVQIGCIVAVKIDVKDPQIIYSAENWSWGANQPPPNVRSKM